MPLCFSYNNGVETRWRHMNDYTSGNRVFALRKQARLSQSKLAEIMGVTDKAVSKWETGKAKPNTNTIRKLAAFFQVDIKELLDLRDPKQNKKITKIVITGGPCAGKSTAMSWVQNAFTQMKALQPYSQSRSRSSGKLPRTTLSKTRRCRRYEGKR